MYVGDFLKTLDRVPSGVPGLDGLLSGGFLPGRVYLVVGPPGSGKTTLGMQFLIEGAKNDEKGVFISLVEHPELIVQNMLKYNFGILNYVKSKRVTFHDLGRTIFESEYKFTWNDLFGSILHVVEAENAKRVVVDSFTSLEYSTRDAENKRIALGRFVRKLQKMNVTTILISEMLSSETYTDEYYLADGVIVIHHFMRNYQMIRALQVLKMHGVPHDSNLKRIRFTGEGLRVYPEAPF